jgi:two-component system alkaline phosphatase synthesis response regulator PhoP
MGFSPLCFRYFCLNTHYRKKLNFTFDALKAAQVAYTRLLNQLYEHKVSSASTDSEKLDKFRADFKAAIEDDINIPMSLGVLWTMLKEAPSKDIYALALEFDKVLGLDSGADDYISKPFGTMELISRIKALLRRVSKPVQIPDNSISVGNLTINQDKHEVIADGKKVPLTLKEYDLLCLLMKKKDRVYTRDELLSLIWGYDFSGESRTVDVHIRTLRSKLGSCGELIETVRGVGYKITAKEH